MSEPMSGKNSSAFAQGLRWLMTARWETLSSTLGIGVLLVLPAGGYMLSSHLAALMQGATVTPELTAFLPVGADRTVAFAVEQKLKALPAVAKTRLLPREDTLARMRASGTSGLADAIAILPGNPFPDAIVVTPTDDEPTTLEALAGTVRQWREVEYVQADADWARRRAALLRLLEAGAWLLATLVGVALIALVFNTLSARATMQRNVTTRRIADSDGDRPVLLWQGVLLGLLGGLAAWLILVGAILWLRLPVAEFAALYGLEFTLTLPGVGEIATLLGSATLLGGAGALLAIVGTARRG